MANDEARFLTVREVAERLQLHPITVRRHIAAGRIRAVRIGRAVRVPQDEVDKFGRREAHVAEPKAAYPAKTRPKLPYRWPLSKKEQKRLKRITDQMLAARDQMEPLGMTTTELIRQERRMLERRHDRWRKPFEEMRRLRDEMEPMDISTADLVHLGRSAREWIYDESNE
jgi:excisionase family DNA binding protein